MSDVIYRQVGLDDHYKVWHKSEKNMFLLIHAGKGGIVSRDKNYLMGKGTLCFIGKNKYHYTFPDVPEQYIRSKLFVSSEELEKIVKLLSPYQELQNMLNEHQLTIGLLDVHDLRCAEDIFEELSRLCSDTAPFQAKSYSAILDLMVLLSRNIGKKPTHNFDNIQTAVEYINSHITEDIRIDQICAVCHMSKYYFCRMFKQKTGVTVMEYILKTRIVMAKELLGEATLTVTEISEACGFSSVSYFSRAFKNETGVSPLQYKKRKTEKIF